PAAPLPRGATGQQAVQPPLRGHAAAAAHVAGAAGLPGAGRGGGHPRGGAGGERTGAAGRGRGGVGAAGGRRGPRRAGGGGRTWPSSSASAPGGRRGGSARWWRGTRSKGRRAGGVGPLLGARRGEAPPSRGLTPPAHQARHLLNFFTTSSMWLALGLIVWEV